MSDTPGESARLDFLAAGGEMGERIRALDWTRTPLGRPQDWPQSLKVAVRIMLTSRQPIWIGWGKELTYLYNTPYKAIIGGKHPVALGQPTSVVWREIWDDIEPLLDQAMTGDEGTYVEKQLLIMERNGYPEETYYTFSYSPIPDDHGGTGGMICANTDDTQRVIGARQLALLRELGVKVADARTLTQALAGSLAALETNTRDVTFAAIYLPDGPDTLRLAGQVGLVPGHPAAQATVRLDAADGWPAGEALRTHAAQHVTDIEERFAANFPGGAWREGAQAAAVLSLAGASAQTAGGVLIVGLNPFRLFDDAYRGFLALVAGQIASGLLSAQAYQAERERAEKLSELDRAKTAFFSNVSHEFRTPLTLMLGPLEDLLVGRHGLLAEEVSGQVGVIQRNALRLQRLVNTLLDFSRVEAGRERAAFEPTDLAAVTAELSSMFRAAVEKAGMQLEVDCPPVKAPVYVDRVMWEKVVLNLLSNALKFTFAGSIAVRVEEVGDEAVLTVRDTGVGIPEKDLPHVFERFHRVEGTQRRSHEGTGIGLALVHELVKLHGGQVGVESVEGEGSTFTIRLPTGVAHLPAERVGAHAEPARGAAVSAQLVDEAGSWLPQADVPVAPVTGNRPRVLLADDNADMRHYVTRLLGERFRVEAVQNGRQALERMETFVPDLLLTDVMMPEVDGFELLARVRAEPRWRDLPVIMLSARAGEESRIEGVEAGADDYLVKPFTARELLARVSTHIETARVRREVARVAREREERQAFLLDLGDRTWSLTNPEEVTRVSSEALAGYLRATKVVLGGEHAPDLIGPELAHEWAQGRRWVIDDVESDPRESVRDNAPAYRAHDVRSAIGVPLVRDGRLVSAALVVDREPRNWSPDDVWVVRETLERAWEVAERARAEAELHEADRRKDQFLAMLAHELRNPLAPVANAIRVLHIKLPDSEPLRWARAVIERQVGHLTQLIDDLLDVARIRRDKLELRKSRVTLDDVVGAAMEMSRPAIEHRGHALQITMPGEKIEMDVDHVRVAQVIMNLLTNAAKYTPHGGRVWLEAAREGDAVMVTVRDDGIGISHENLPRVFDMFFQEERANERSPGGLGMGLWLVRRLVQMHGGRVSAESEGQGRGSTFKVLLPVVAADAPAASVVHPAAKEAVTARRVLIVDDLRDSADSLAMMLELGGHTVRTAYDGIEAFGVAEEFRPDVVLLDIGMPKLDGYEVARRIRATGWGESMLLVAVTGWERESDREESLAAGFDHHLVKPVAPDLFARILSVPWETAS